jgi:hypothetical protein
VHLALAARTGLVDVDGANGHTNNDIDQLMPRPSEKAVA